MLDPWYITGFCDGEATFTFSRSGKSLVLYFSIKQRDDNKQIVEEIQSYFGGIGNIYKDVYFRVTRNSELSAIIEHFDKYPLKSQKKYEAYCIWREMVQYKADNYRSNDCQKLEVLAQKLQNNGQSNRGL